MKINSVLVSPLKNHNFKTNRNFQLNFYGSDVFERVQTPRLAKNFPFEENCKNFEKDLSEYVFSSSEYNFNEVRKIIKSYCPDVVVCDTSSDIVENTITSKHQNSYLQNYSLIKKGDKIDVVAKEKQMFLKAPTKWDMNAKVSFFETILHEAIHMFQANSLDRSNKVEFYNRLISNQKYFNLSTYSINVLIKSWLSLQREMSPMIAKVLKDSPYPSNKINRETTSLLFKKNSDETLKQYSRKMFDKYMKDNEYAIKIFGRENVLEDFISELHDEAEAYEKSNRALIKYADIDEMYGSFNASFELVRAEIYKEILLQETIEKNKIRPFEKF